MGHAGRVVQDLAGRRDLADGTRALREGDHGTGITSLARSTPCWDQSVAVIEDLLVPERPLQHLAVLHHGPVSALLTSRGMVRPSRLLSPSLDVGRLLRSNAAVVPDSPRQPRDGSSAPYRSMTC